MFEVPIYENQIYSPDLEKVQDEFVAVFNALNDNNAFQHRQGWNTHLLSDVTFKQNLLQEYSVPNFRNELDKHLKYYLQMLRYNGSLEYRIRESWMTLFKNSMHAHTHSHGDIDISGCYYFKTNSQDGDFFFESPYKSISTSHCFRFLGSRSIHKPVVGKILLFPGWMEHGVLPNTTDNDRVSVSFNIVFEKHGMKFV